MTNTEITHDILENLIQARDPEDIILNICEKYGLSWQEAETLVLQVQEEHRDTITLRQAPIRTAIALATFLGGSVVLASGIYPIVFAIVTLLQRDHSGRLLTSWQVDIMARVMDGIGLDPFMAISLGIALVLGSLIGMQDIWAALLPRLKIWR